MHDRERERELWRQSGARYRVKEEKRTERRADTFEADTMKQSGRRFPLHLADLENEYGNVEFTKQPDKSLVVSFARKREFKEPVFKRDEEKITENRLVKERAGSMMRMRNSGSPFGAEAFVLTKEKSAAKQVNRILKEAAKPLEEMARSMASLLVPASQDVMPQAQMDMIYEDLVRTARHAVEKGREQMEEEERMKKEGTLRPVKICQTGNGEDKTEEDEKSGKSEAGEEESVTENG